MSKIIMNSRKKMQRKIMTSRTHKPEEMTVEEWQRALRREFGGIQKFRIKNTGGKKVFSEFSVTNPETKRTYRVAVRGECPGDNFCSCPDFSINTLGTCKHLEFVLSRIRKNHQRRNILSCGCSLPHSEVFLRYGSCRYVIFKSGTRTPEGLKSLASKYFDCNHVLRDDAFQHFGVFLENARKLEPDLRYYDDALEFISGVQEAEHRHKRLAELFPRGIESPAFNGLLKISLYPYQREGVLMR